MHRDGKTCVQAAEAETWEAEVVALRCRVGGRLRNRRLGGEEENKDSGGFREAATYPFENAETLHQDGLIN